MSAFRNIQELDAKVRELKKIQHLQEELIASNFREIKEDLHPRQLLKNSLNTIVHDAAIRKDVLEKLLEIATLWAAKKWLGKKVPETKLKSGSAGLLSEAVRMAFENKDQLKAIGVELFNRVFKSQESNQGDSEANS